MRVMLYSYLLLCFHVRFRLTHIYLLYLFVYKSASFAPNSGVKIVGATYR